MSNGTDAHDPSVRFADTSPSLAMGRNNDQAGALALSMAATDSGSSLI
jgi:hypothetical protein